MILIATSLLLGIFAMVPDAHAVSNEEICKSRLPHSTKHKGQMIIRHC